MKSPPAYLSRIVAVLVIWIHGVVAGGIPEPSVVFYGIVTDNQGARLTLGTIEWVLDPGNGQDPVTVTGELSNVNDQFSFVLQIRCESPLPGEPALPNTLPLAFPAIEYDRSTVAINGQPASFVDANLKTFLVGTDDRGRLERIDLTLASSPVDADGNGLPDDWEIAYFGHTGVDPDADPDGDGLSNAEESKAGTNPTDFQSQFRIIQISTSEEPGWQIEWSSVAGRTYSVLRSTSLLEGFETIASGIAATPDLNVFQDTGATGPAPYFYVIQVEAPGSPQP